MATAVHLDRATELQQCEERIAKYVASCIEAGDALETIKRHKLYIEEFDSFEDYCRERWKFTERHVRRLIDAAKVANSIRQNDQLVPLPSSESVARELRSVIDEECRVAIWKLALEQAEVPTAADVREAIRIGAARFPSDIRLAAQLVARQASERRRKKALKRIREALGATPPLDGLGRFPVLLADPPWSYGRTIGEITGPENHYLTMELADICALPVPAIAADDCILFLWTTPPKLEEAFKVLEAWGFTYKTCAVWHKEAGTGMGLYFRQVTEHLLVATRGRIPTPAPEARPLSLITAPRGRHSEKPELVHELIERMYPGLPKLELFARKCRSGWTSWGNHRPSEPAESLTGPITQADRLLAAGKVSD